MGKEYYDEIFSFLGGKTAEEVLAENARKNEQEQKPADVKAVEPVSVPVYTPPNGLVEPGSTPTYIPPENGDKLAELPILLLDDYATGMEKQPFKPYSAEQMKEMVEDVRRNGVLQPLLVRRKQDGRYEIIAGHSRRDAAATLSYQTVPCIVRKMTDDVAIQQMISTNLNQRKNLLPSEKAWAYRYQLDAMKRQGQRTDLTSAQLGQKLETRFSVEVLAEQVDESRTQIQRYIRLTYLIPKLLDQVDTSALGLTIGATLSYIRHENQKALEQYCFEEHRVYISQEIADELRKADSTGMSFSEETLSPLLQMKESVTVKMKVSTKVLKRYFPVSTPQKAIEKTVDAALKQYFSAGGRVCD